MSLTKTNVNLFLRANSAEGLVEQQLINNAVNGLHFNYQTPVYDGTAWYVWFFYDVRQWRDPSEFNEQEIEMIRGAS